MTASHTGLDSLLCNASPATKKATLVAALTARNHSSQTSAGSMRTVIVPPIASATHGRGADAPAGQAQRFPDLCRRGNRLGRALLSVDTPSACIRTLRSGRLIGRLTAPPRTGQAGGRNRRIPLFGRLRSAGDSASGDGPGGESSVQRAATPIGGQ